VLPSGFLSWGVYLGGNAKSLLVLLGLSVAAFAATLALELYMSGMLALALSCFVAGFWLGRIMVRWRASPTAFAVSGLALGFLAASIYVVSRLYMYAVTLESLSVATVEELVALAHSSGTLYVMLLVYGVAGALLASAGVVLSTLIEG
jgi:hypothetical protein